MEHLTNQLETLVQDCRELIAEDARFDGEIADFSAPFYAQKLRLTVKGMIEDSLCRVLPQL